MVTTSSNPAHLEPAMTYRIVNTAENVQGPHGFRYMHDAARPFALLRDAGRREICHRRYSTEAAAKKALRALTRD